MPTKKSPQAKKKLSYERDRRNAFHENNKASRKAIPRNKRSVVRQYRRAVTATMAAADPAADLDSAVKEVKRKKWKKVADEPLGEVVRWKLKKRKAREDVNATRRKKAC